MAVFKALKKDIPEDAVIISEDEALTMHWEIISKWKNLSEVWALRFGPGVLAAMATTTGIFVNNHYRRKLRLGTYGRLSTYLPIVVVPAMFTLASHKFFVQRHLLLDPERGCPTCLQMRAAAFQTALGVVYPTILAPIASCMFATRHFTYRLPSITEKPKEVFQLIKKFTKPIGSTLTTILLGQGLIAIYLTYKEQQQNLQVLIKLAIYERKLQEKLENQ